MNFNIFGSVPAIDVDKNLTLRELSLEDAQHYYQYMSNEHLRPFLVESAIPFNVEDAKKEVIYLKNLFFHKTGMYWGIVLKDTNKIIGSIGFNYISKEHRKGEISYDLDFNHWNRGIMSIVLRSVLNFVDQNLKLIRIQATTMTYNSASIKMLQNFHFKKEGVLKNYLIVNQKSIDCYMFSRTM